MLTEVALVPMCKSHWIFFLLATSLFVQVVLPLSKTEAVDGRAGWAELTELTELTSD